MTKVVVITSGKGGVGKTTTSASFAMGLAIAGFKTVAIDFDIGLRNLDLILGCERRVIYDIASVINGEANVQQALIKDKTNPNLYVLAASQTRDKNILTKDGIGAIISELSQSFDYIVCDSPAGIEQGALMAMYYADSAIVVTNPEVSAVRDADRILGFLDSKTAIAETGKEMDKHLVITRYTPKRATRGDMMSVEDIQELLGIPLLGVVNECESVLQASNEGVPVILNNKSLAGQSYRQIVDRFLGKMIINSKKKSLFTRWFTKKRETIS